MLQPDPLDYSRVEAEATLVEILAEALPPSYEARQLEALRLLDRIITLLDRTTQLLERTMQGEGVD